MTITTALSGISYFTASYLLIIKTYNCLFTSITYLEL